MIKRLQYHIRQAQNRDRSQDIDTNRQVKIDILSNRNSNGIELQLAKTATNEPRI